MQWQKRYKQRRWPSKQQERYTQCRLFFCTRIHRFLFRNLQASLLPAGLPLLSASLKGAFPIHIPPFAYSHFSFFRSCRRPFPLQDCSLWASFSWCARPLSTTSRSKACPAHSVWVKEQHVLWRLVYEWGRSKECSNSRQVAKAASNEAGIERRSM